MLGTMNSQIAIHVANVFFLYSKLTSHTAQKLSLCKNSYFTFCFMQKDAYYSDAYWFLTNFCKYFMQLFLNRNAFGMNRKVLIEIIDANISW